MDAVGLAASILALVQGAAFLLEYVKDVKDGASDRAELRLSLAALPGLLMSLKDQFDNTAPNTAGAVATANLAVQDGPFTQLIALLQRIQSKLNIPPSRTGELWQRLKWTLDKADVTELLLKVERVKSLIMLALQNNHVALSREIQKDVQELHQQMEDVSSGVSAVSVKVEDMAQQVLQQIEPMAANVKQLQDREINADLRAFAQWLSPLNFQANQDNFFSKCASGTGDWLIKHPEFQLWISGQVNLLWCPGKPGVGKTILASKCVHHLQSNVLQPGVGVACIFFDYRLSSSQTTVKVLGSVLRQLLIDSPSVPESLEPLHTAFTSGRTPPSSLGDFKGALAAQLQLYSHVYLVVDALDECLEDQQGEFIAEIQALMNTGRLRVWITSRDIAAIGQQFKNNPRIDLLAHNEDVRSYILQRIWKEKRLQSLLDGDSLLEQKIVEEVTKKADGMFLLVQLHMDTLASKNNRKALRDALSTLPKEIYRSYDDAMSRIDSQGPDDSQLARKLFMWLAYGEKWSLFTDHIHYALAISPGMVEMDLDAITSVEILSTICAGLIVAGDHLGPVRFVHYTTQEYFRLETSQKHFRLNEITEYFELPMDITFPFAHFSIATTCFTYLSFKDLKFSDPEYRYRDVSPLFEYSVRHWGDHAQRCEHMLCTIPRARDLVLKFFKNEAEFMHGLYNVEGQGWSLTFRLLHILARFGSTELMAMILESGAGIDCLDGQGRTPLMHAVKYNHLPMVKFLIGQGAHHVLSELCYPRRQDTTSLCSRRGPAHIEH
ncbi:hypothetical protein C8F04DRAFT_92936 [Mycena alexandri]|uniref:Nephrocystin 3-like N-terminal domain-containing protein n=1 Tax=Mycena alexandri TaxID=1745969 RepID=A0AAD6WU39_9AGAR|nr:hypothetical protein C8F04DRAFT_92936 [Mycena alexandri]